MVAVKKILIVDDDVTALDIVDYLFEDRGFAVHRSADGAGALASLSTVHPDIILVDLMMPKMTGQECVREIRSRGVVVPIIAFTAVDDPDIHEEALEAGCNLVLTKPCKPVALVNHVEEQLRIHSPEA